MDGSDWVTGVLSAIAIVVSVIAIRQTRRGNRHSETSANAAKESALEAKRSADAAEESVKQAARSADAAERAAEAAAEANRLEHERDHDRLCPTFPGVIKASLDPAVAGMRGLMASITVDRTYRVTAEARWDDGRASGPIGMRLVLHAGQPKTFQIEAWPPGKTQPTAEEILFKFWPPIPGTDGADWNCPCSRPNGAGTGAGHWEVPVRVQYVPAPQGIGWG